MRATAGTSGSKMAKGKLLQIKTYVEKKCFNYNYLTK